MMMPQNPLKSGAANELYAIDEVKFSAIVLLERYFLF